jgi:integrase
MPGTEGHRGFGHIRRLPSGHWQASYVGPDLARHTAPTTFDDKDTAVIWLRRERTFIESDDWKPPKARAAARRRDSFATYSTAWLAHRPLKPRTVAHYRSLLDRVILPTFGAMTVRHITPESVRVWFAGLDPHTPTQNAHSYALLKAICATAVTDDLLPANPCRVRGAGQAKRASRTEPATVEELTLIVDSMPKRYRLMVLLAAWTALRLGELTELRRSDIDLTGGRVRVRRAVVWIDGSPVVQTPKSGAGVRDVTIPPHVLPAVREHLRAMPVAGKDALLFPAASDPTAHMQPATLYKVWDRARRIAARPDLRFHDLRHTGAVLATLTGASLIEVMRRLGHSTPAAAMRYQSVAKGRDAEIAAALSKLAGDAQ